MDGAIGRLRRLVEPPPPKQEKCELCGAPIAAQHGHIVDMGQRRLLCACRPCYLLFTHSGAAGGKLRSVSERCVRVRRPEIGEIPVGVVFFIRDSGPAGVKAFYPSPAGATESSVSKETWEEMAAADARIAGMEADIEALLVSKKEAWIVPVDACYELTGRIKKTWRGFDGGRESWREIDAFFAELKETEALA